MGQRDEVLRDRFDDSVSVPPASGSEEYKKVNFDLLASGSHLSSFFIT